MPLVELAIWASARTRAQVLLELDCAETEVLRGNGQCADALSAMVARLPRLRVRAARALDLRGDAFGQRGGGRGELLPVGCLERFDQAGG